MSRFDCLMREDITYLRQTGTGPSGGKTYDAPAVIPGRLEWQRRKIVNDRGEEAVSEAVLYTPHPLRPGDVIVVDEKQWPVRAVAQRKDLFGQTDHWEVRL